MAKASKVERELEEREARRRIAQAQIRQFPDPVLRSDTRRVDEFDDELAALVERMIEIGDDAVGAGLAAPQIGLLRRIAVVNFRDDEPWIPLVNPDIVEYSDETEVGGEGCLSLDVLLREQHSVPVERSTRIVLRWQDVEGTEHERELTDMDARIVQHEVDHLDGILTIDRAPADAKREALRILRERI